MGEAGPEAIMPLKRGADGSLGVRALPSESSRSGATIIEVNAPVSITQEVSSGDTNNANTGNTARLLQSIIQTTISERLKKEISPGGLLYR